MFKNEILKNDCIDYKKSNYTCIYSGLSYNSYIINLYFNKPIKNHDEIINILELYILDNIYNTLHFGYYINKIEIQGMHAFVSIDINTD